MVSRIVNCSTSTRAISVQRRNSRAASYISSRDLGLAAASRRLTITASSSCSNCLNQSS
jgi:hypothetical protein